MELWEETQRMGGNPYYKIYQELIEKKCATPSDGPSPSPSAPQSH